MHADSDPAAALDALDEARQVAARVGNRLVTGITLTVTVALRPARPARRVSYGKPR